ncbi:MAG: hypothetical protein R3B52_03320 [Candidatus Paceibacterota bacterium]
MDLSSIIGISILLLLWGAQLKKRSLLGIHARKIFVVAILAQYIGPFIQTQKYFTSLLLAPPPARYLIPPYQSLSYFLFTAQRKFWVPYFISLLVALLIIAALRALPQKTFNRIFEKEEPYIIALCVALCPNPLWIFYIGVTLALYLVASIVTTIFTKEKRSSLYQLWIPAGIITLLLIAQIKTIEPLGALLLFR